jgi:biopolymer transport protein ExbB/TolQ
MSTCLPAFLLLSSLAACSTAEEPDAAERERVAQQAAQKAVQQAKEAQAQLDKDTKDLDDLNEKISKAVDAIVAAQNDDDRAAARARLKQLRQDQAEMRARLTATPPIGDFDTPECIRNPRGSGCSGR